MDIDKDDSSHISICDKIQVPTIKTIHKPDKKNQRPDSYQDGYKEFML